MQCNIRAATDNAHDYLDASLREKEKFVNGPLGLNGATGKPVSKYSQTLLKPKNHRFASYASVLKKFP